MVDGDLLVHNFWINNDWNTVLLSACLPTDIVGKITCIPISNVAQCDRQIWHHTGNGKFSVKSAYMSTLDLNSRPSHAWKWMWNLHIPPKLKVFTWLFFNCRLLTNVNRVRRKLTLDPSCPHCPGVPETMIHLFRDCPKARVIWNAIGGPITIQRSVTLNWEAWIAANIFQKNCEFLNMLWPHLFIFVCWFI